jgi:hypothetical protein
MKTLVTNKPAGKSRKMTLDIGSRNDRRISGLPIRKVFVNVWNRITVKRKLLEIGNNKIELTKRLVALPQVNLGVSSDGVVEQNYSLGVGSWYTK